MRRALAGGVALLLALVQPGWAQASSRLSIEGAIGLAFREDRGVPGAEAQGFQGFVRLGRPLLGTLRLVGEAGASGFPRVLYAVTDGCPPGVVCPAQQQPGGGPQLVTVSAGLQHQVGTGPMTLVLTATGGATWLRRHAPGTPGWAPAVGGAAGIRFPGSHLRLMLEARTVRHFGLREGPGWVNAGVLGVVVQ